MNNAGEPVFSFFLFNCYFCLFTSYPFAAPLLPHVSAAYDSPMQVQLSHPARTVEVKGPKKVKELLRELNLVVEAHLVIKGDDLVTEDEMLYDVDQIEVRPVISGGNQAEAEAKVEQKPPTDSSSTIT
jgi:sulfur carrier protein